MRNGCGKLAGLFVIGVLGSLNCGSGGGGSGGGSVTSVSGSKSLNTLTAAEKTQLCNDSGAYAGRVLSKANACKAIAFLGGIFADPPPQTDAEAQAACMTTYNQCLAAPATGGTNTCDDIPANCTATVDQYSACLSEGVAAASQTFAAFPSCNMVTLMSNPGGSGGSGGTSTPTSAACMAFQAACPGFDVPSPGM
jgi:hypothetical protein